jgi:GNAT superfamily N-acetyltransferase
MTSASPEYVVSTDKSRLDLVRIYRWLSEEANWAQDRTREVVERSIQNSVVFGAYRGREQVGLARAVTDGVTCAWLCDVFVSQDHRGRGVGKLLVRAAAEYADGCGLRIMVLATRDAQGFYERYGDFHVVERPGGWMVRRPVDGPPSCARLG